MQENTTVKTDSLKSRYLKLAVLVIIAGNIYPLIYLRQNFEVSILESFGITTTQLGQNYAMLGVLFMVTYLPSGWLADRISPRILMSFSLALAGLLGVWFSTIPSFQATQVIFAGWGIAAGLTFWSALIKATTLLAKPDEQGRFFGILDGGRGLVEAVLATIAVAIFAYYTQSLGQDTPEALRKVIWMYVAMMLTLAPMAYFMLEDHSQVELLDNKRTKTKSNVWQNLKTIISKLTPLEVGKKISVVNASEDSNSSSPSTFSRSKKSPAKPAAAAPIGRIQSLATVIEPTATAVKP